MKGLVLLFLLAFCTRTVGIDQDDGSKSDKKDILEIKFENTTYDFGKIKFAGDGTYSFKFENIGKESIVITKVKTFCGCTITSWTKEPIKPGKTGAIVVKYNTRQIGTFSKSIMVYSSGTNSPILLTIKGQVEMKD